MTRWRPLPGRILVEAPEDPERRGPVATSEPRHMVCRVLETAAGEADVAPGDLVYVDRYSLWVIFPEARRCLVDLEEVLLVESPDEVLLLVVVAG